MLKQVLWELRKILFKKSFWVMFSVIFILVLMIYCSDVKSGKMYSTDPDYTEIYQSYDRMGYDEYDNIIKKEEEKVKLNPDKYVASIEMMENGREHRIYNEFGLKQQLFLSHVRMTKNYYDSAIKHKNEFSQQMTKLEEQGKKNTYQYRLLSARVNEYSKIQKPVLSRNVLCQAFSPLTAVGIGDDANMVLAFLLISALIVFSISPIFAKERKYNMDYILLTTKNGRTKSLYSKLLASIVFSAGIMLFFQIIMLILYLTVFEFKFSDPLISTTLMFFRLNFVTESYNELLGLSIGQTYLILLAFCIMGSILVGLVTAFLSALIKKSALVSVIGTLMILYPPILYSVTDAMYCSDYESFGGMSLPTTIAFGFAKYNLLSMMNPAEYSMWITDYVNIFGFPVKLYAVLATVILLICALMFFAPKIYVLRCNAAKTNRIKKGVSYAETNPVGA